MTATVAVVLERKNVEVISQIVLANLSFYRRNVNYYTRDKHAE